MKFIERWKQEWWLKNAQELSKKFNENRLDLIRRCAEEIKQVEDQWKLAKEVSLQKIALDQEEIKYRIESLESRKRELAHLDTEVKNQMKMLEAKANPTFVWETAFTAGATKTWDLMEKIMLGNIEKMKTHLFNEATQKAVENLHANPKKTH